MKVFQYTPGKGPLLVSMPHDGTAIPDDVARVMTDDGRAVADTDWHISRLYDFLEGSQSHRLQANFSRYVVDLNRPADGAALYPGHDETGLCPLSSFEHKALYQPGFEPDQQLIQQRIERFWRPYHQQLQSTLEKIRDRHGYALLWDAHSIRSRVPRFFEGQLPDFNLGTVNGESCPEVLLESLRSVLLADGQFSVATNARFQGGYITRHYAAPENNIFAVQLELSQATYMDESGSNAYRPELAATVQIVIEELLERFQSAALAS